MKVTIKSVTMSVFEPDCLCPAPSVRDWEYIKEELDKDTTPRFKNMAEFVGRPLELLATYRGWNLYLQGGVCVTRSGSGVQSTNGYAFTPSAGTVESGRLTWDNAVYICEVEFN
jgi:hypothetical protein